MNIFDLSEKEFKKNIKQTFFNINKDDLLKDLIECGLEIQKGDKDD